MTFTQTAWKAAAPLLAKIIDHPFNQELGKGTLDMNKFLYYIEQDNLYLVDFGRSLTLLAAKMPQEHVRDFLHHADQAFATEQELVHQYYKREPSCPIKGLSPANIGYSSYLLRTVLLEPVEVGLCALLPCFWIYHEVGKALALNAHPENPYLRWIETYSGKDFSEAVDHVIGVTNALALHVSPGTMTKMQEALLHSTAFELHFWDDAYKGNSFGFYSVEDNRVSSPAC